MYGKLKSAIAILMIALSLNFNSTVFAGTNNLGGGNDYEFDFDVETKPSTNDQIVIDIVNTKIDISTPSDADPDDDFEFDDEDDPVSTPSDATPSKTIILNPKDPKNPVTEPSKDDIVNYPANIQTPPTLAPEHIEEQKVGTIEAYYDHSRTSLQAKYYIDDNGVLHPLPSTGDTGSYMAFVSFAISLAGLIYLIHDYKHNKKKDEEETS